MIKLPRFVKEFYNFTVKCVKESEFMLERYKEIKLKEANRILNCMEKGMITIAEGMKLLSDI